MVLRQPIIGVTTTVIPRNSGFFGQMARRAAEHDARLILFHPEHFHANQGVMTGYEWDHRGEQGFEKVTARLPDVIYENVFVHLVMQGKVRALRQQAALHGIPVFNPLISGKAATSKWIADCSSCGLHVPATRKIHSVDVIDDMLMQYGVLYVKPSGGYGGRGVFRIAKDRGKISVHCDRFYERGHLRLSLNPAEFRSFAAKHVLRVPHIAQERIPLLTYRGGQVDFRVVIQRNRSGAWELVGIVPKIAAPNGVVTNLVAGGSRMRFSVLQTALKQQGLTIDEVALERTALAVGQMLIKRYKRLGIIGYDLGLDVNGQPWFIELNPKPARRLLFPDMQRKASDLAVDFGLFLATEKGVQGR
ncbi:MAG: YheC/YheD family protein [Acidibacillus sp.]|uniref:Endospore coat-associated protein YheD n=1 Tax=Sulfoacidibacillus ferrooxidans TaxID=2005001 RepID=A0A9X2AAT3_9BACL|nr:YheC/YheD family protein [Sulfoacidibacillus ferrooxidans]MCI0181944.1 Endospore coat-associated protein YheD [Sulfoacidibacillus ferrooxidans]MCY0893394.1 YheC/YheD family protein [Acidibacillus sp.]